MKASLPRALRGFLTGQRDTGRRLALVGGVLLTGLGATPACAQPDRGPMPADAAPASKAPRVAGSTPGTTPATTPATAPSSRPDAGSLSPERNPATDAAFPFQYEALRIEGGGTFRLQSVEGEPLMLHFWASWCRPCLAEMPRVATLHARHAAAGLRLLTISVDENPAALRAFLQRSPVPGILLHDPSNEAGLVFGVGNLPATLIYDRRGRLLWSTEHMLSPDDPTLQRAIDAALKP